MYFIIVACGLIFYCVQDCEMFFKILWFLPWIKIAAHLFWYIHRQIYPVKENKNLVVSVNDLGTLCVTA